MLCNYIQHNLTFNITVYLAYHYIQHNITFNITLHST